MADEKEVFTNSSYIMALGSIIVAWVGWALRKIFVIDRDYISREEFNRTMDSVRKDIKDLGHGVHTRLDDLIRDELNRRER